MHKWDFYRTTRLLAVLYIVLICFSCQMPGSSQKGFGIDDPENVFFLSSRENFILYQYNENRDTLIPKARFKDIGSHNLFYNTKLDKIYNFCLDNISRLYGIRIYDRPKGKPKWFAERRTAYYSVYPYKDDYLIVDSYLFPPEEQGNKPAVGDMFYYNPNTSYTKVYFLETSINGNVFTKQYDSYYNTVGFIHDSLIYSNFHGSFFSLNIETGGINELFQYNFFHHNMFTIPAWRGLDHFFDSPSDLPPPCRVLVAGEEDIYIIPQNFALGTGKKEIQAYNHLYNTYKVNTLYKYVGDNEFEKVLEVPMKKDVAWATAMDDCIFFVGKKENKTELVRLDLLSKQTQQLSLNKENYLAFLAGRTKDYFILMLRNSKVKTNKHILAIVPKNLESEPKFYNLPPGFNTSNPVYFTFSSKYDNNVLGFMQDGIIRYNPENR